MIYTTEKIKLTTAIEDMKHEKAIRRKIALLRRQQENAPCLDTYYRIQYQIEELREEIQ
jgi:hypothetical protein